MAAQTVAAGIPSPAAHRRGHGRIAVADCCPARRLGIAAALDHAGFRVESLDHCEDLAEWLTGADAGAAVLALEDRDSWELLPATGTSSPPIAALVPDRTVAAVRAALLGGATAVLATNAPLDELVIAVDAVLIRRTLLPEDIAWALAVEVAEPPSAALADRVSAQEAHWLEVLARGGTVAGLAGAAAFSEREMHRRLRALYRRLGAANRTQAVVAAVRCGLVTDGGEPAQ